MFIALCVNTVIETLHDTCLSVFLRNIVIVSVTRALRAWWITSSIDYFFCLILRLPVTICSWSLSLSISEPSYLYDKIESSWIKALTLRIRVHWLKLNILGIIDHPILGTTWSSSFISLGKHSFTDWSWTIWSTLLSPHLFFERKFHKYLLVL